jgi:hypothetical protein
MRARVLVSVCTENPGRQSEGTSFAPQFDLRVSVVVRALCVEQTPYVFHLCETTENMQCQIQIKAERWMRIRR